MTVLHGYTSKIYCSKTYKYFLVWEETSVQFTDYKYMYFRKYLNYVGKKMKRKKDLTRMPSCTDNVFLPEKVYIFSLSRSITVLSFQPRVWVIWHPSARMEVSRCWHFFWCVTTRGCKGCGLKGASVYTVSVAVILGLPRKLQNSFYDQLHRELGGWVYFPVRTHHTTEQHVLGKHFAVLCSCLETRSYTVSFSLHMEIT